MRIRRVSSLVVLFLCLGVFGESQQKQIKHAPVELTIACVGSRDVHRILRRLSRQGWQGKRSGC
jgi:hypothetical protein